VPDPPAVGDLRDRLGVAAGFAVSPEIRVPATFGLRRPAILLPPGFDALPADQQRAVACHEMIHVRRRDWLFSLAEEGVGTLFWFHPAVAWALGRIRLAREQTVDRGVVALTRAPRPYLEALVELARSASRAPAPAALFLKESHLKKRVDLLLEEVSMSRARLTVTVAASTAALVLTAGLAVWAFPLVAAAEKGREGKTARPPRPIHSVPVAYPEKAKEDRIEGDVVLEITIEKSGAVSNAVVVSGPELLAPAAVAAVRQWRYESSRVGPMTARVTVRFTLDEKKKEGASS